MEISGVKQILTGLKIPDSTQKVLIGGGKKSKLFAVTAVSWDLAAPPEPPSVLAVRLQMARQRARTTPSGTAAPATAQSTVQKAAHVRLRRKAKTGTLSTDEQRWLKANAVRIRLWNYIKNDVRATMHHESFWFLPSSDQKLLGEVEAHFDAADKELIQLGMHGTRYDIFPLVTDIAFEASVARNFTMRIQSAIGPLTRSYQEVNQHYEDAQEFLQSSEEDEKKEGEEMVSGIKVRARLLDKKMRTLDALLKRHPDYMKNLTPEEQKAVDDQLDAVRRGLPRLLGTEL